jgi:hypothetical protein
MQHLPIDDSPSCALHQLGMRELAALVEMLHRKFREQTLVGDAWRALS